MVASRSGGCKVRYEYDALGHLIKRILPDGNTQTFAYDAMGNLIGETDVMGYETQYAYNQESWLEKVTYANGSTQQLTYDLSGKVAAEVDAEGASLQYRYDRVGRLTQVIDALGGTTSYKYNALDLISQVKDALGRVTKYEYDLQGKLTAETDALGNKTQYDYTPEGWLASITKPDGKVICYSYDKTGNLLTQDAAGEEMITQAYNEVGQLTTVETVDGKTEYQYNDKGQLITVKYTDGSTLGYAYDEYGRKASLTYPDGKVVRYEYDAMDRLVKVIGLEGETTTYTYDAAGRRVKTECDGLVTTYDYDAVGNLTAQTTSGKTALELTYTYTPGGRMASETRTEQGEAAISQYVYNPLGQLTSFARSDGYSEAYTYDAVGNMTQKLLAQDDMTTKLTMLYNKGNQMTSMQSPLGKIDYKYDQNGNMIGKKLGKLQDTYTYDVMDRLTGFTGYDGFEQTYSYDAMGLRSSMQQKGDANRLTLEDLLKVTHLEAAQPETQAEKDAAAPDADEWVKTSYIYDITLPHGQMLTETTSGVSTAYTYGFERISSQTQTTSGNLTTLYVYDGRGSVAQSVSSMPGTSKLEVSTFTYSAFGEQLGEKITGFGYNSEWFDAATGMQNLRARQYEPAMMRFGQKDWQRGSLTNPLSLNRFAYCCNDPVLFVDPSGQIAILDSLKNLFNSIAKTIVQGTVDFLSSAAVYVENESKKLGGDKKAKEAQQAKDAATPLSSLNFLVMRTGYNYLSPEQKAVYNDAVKKLSKPGLSNDERRRIFLEACSAINEVAKIKNDPSNPDSGKVFLDDYFRLSQLYGFDAEEAAIVYKLKSNINASDKYTQMEKDALYAMLLGGLSYNGTNWNQTVGVSIDNVEKMMKEFGLTDAEYNLLRYKVRIQNQIASNQWGYDYTILSEQQRKDYKEAMERALGYALSEAEFERLWRAQYDQMVGKSDFAHQNITTATALYTGLPGTSHLLLDFAGWTDDVRESMAGWLGDATIGNPTSFGNDDYHADLDSANIVYLMRQSGLSYDEASKQYYSKVNANESVRATMFLEHTPIEKVKFMVYSNLGYQNLTEDVIKAWNDAGVDSVLEELRYMYPDTYNFVRSLEENSGNMQDYHASDLQK